MIRLMSSGSCLLFLLAACVDAEPCTATDNADGTYTIECPDGSSFTLSDGEDGQDGAQGPQGEAGADGEPCTATDNGDGTYSIDCPDGTSVTVSDGADGADGSQGTQGAIGQDGEDGADGQDGYSALVSVDSEVGDNCFGGSTGTRIQSGSDNGDGGGIARDGILQAGEVDSTVYLCIDCAGDLNGTDSSCVDCAGVFNGGAVEDACGICGGDGSSCVPPPEGFVSISAGTFTMGSPESELGRDDDETQHEVTLTNDFYMSDHEVTQAEWQALIDNNPSGNNNGTCDTCPVETVNWWEALHYANALSESEGLTACYVLSGCNGNAVGADKECTGVTLQDGSGNAVTTPYECAGYRLPTEAEWEYAARAGTTTAFYNGYLTSETGSDPNANAIAWYDQNSAGNTHAVKGKLPNAWELYDMSGNVGEWTWDRYGSYSGDVTDPIGSDSGQIRTWRGGHWDSYASRVRVAVRGNVYQNTRYGFIGFRLARTVQ